MAEKGLTWRGEEVTDETILASARAIDSLLDDCVTAAVAEAPFRTGKLRRGIRRRPARAVRDGAVGRWGVYRVPYAVIVERRDPFLVPVADRLYPLLAARVADEYAKGA